MLAPVGRVEGRLVAPGNEPIKGVMVKATTKVGGYAGSGQGGRAEVGCDAEGRFEIAEIAAGPLSLILMFDRENGTRLRGEPPRRLVVDASRTVCREGRVSVPSPARRRCFLTDRGRADENDGGTCEDIPNPCFGPAGR